MGVAPSSCTIDDEPSDEDNVDIFSLTDPAWTNNPRHLASLCSKCTSMVEAWQEMRMLPLDTEKDLSLECEHYATFEQLVASADSGCGICYQFSQAPAKGGVKFKSDKLPPSKIVCWVGSARKKTPERYYFWLQFLADLELRRPPFRTLWIEPAVHPDLAWNYDSVKAPSTQDALPLCKAWLRKCRENHVDCGPPSSEILPTRLLFLGEDIPRLVTSDSVPKKTEYATLSHCWGTLQFTTLTSKTLASFQTAIPLDALTKTFQDAISIAKYLGFDYLWIDSLCIIQDSAEDWRKESSLMGQVYGYASLNIAATTATDGSGGCFFDRNPSWRSQIRTGEEDDSTLWDCWRDGWKYPESNNKLLPRAWVVQERYLSRRVLHFTHDQVYWECEQRPACEMYPNGYPRDQKKDNYSEGFQYRKRPLGLKAWSRIVDAYSAAKLTKYTDRYAAIEGPARMMSEELGVDYVAGMWRQGLERQLCWAATVCLENTACTMGKAPTWSWMAVKGPIKADEPSDDVTRLAVGVESLDVEYGGGNVFDGVERAVLRLRCEYLFRGVIMDVHPKHKKSDSQPPQTSSSDKPKAPNRPNFARGFLGGCYFGPDLACEDPKMMRVHWDVVSKPGPERDSIEAFVLPVKVDRELGLSQAWGLVLQPTGKAPGEYRRIGAFQPTKIVRPEVNPELEALFREADAVAGGRTECFAARGLGDGEAACYIDVI